MLDVAARNALIHRLRARGWSLRRIASHEGVARQQEGILDLKDVVHHTDRRSQYTSIRFTERLAEAGIQPSVGAIGSSYDNALAETINGLYKTELIKPRKLWRTIEDVELTTAAWGHGSSTAASTNPAAIYHPPSWRPPTALNAADQPPAELSRR